MLAKALVIDDEADIRELLTITLERMNLQVHSAATLRQAREHLHTHTFDVCLTDLRLPDGDGMTLLTDIGASHPQLPVAVITAHGNIELATRAMRAGAFDFVAKPVELKRLRQLVSDALRANRQLATRRLSHDPSLRISGASPAVLTLREQIHRVARSQAPVFIRGESGSGKELVARAIHECSGRSDGPFVAVNCGAIPSELMESELFGHRKGAFTGADQDRTGLFEAARSGTLFLDELADLPLAMQVKLLRVIQEKRLRPIGAREEVDTDVRLLSASHKALPAEIAAGRFRQDLYYRINVIELGVPALRERSEDIPLLAKEIMRNIALEQGMEAPRLSQCALDALTRYDFPGNVRELENIIQRAFTLHDGGLIKAAHLALTDPAPAFSDEAYNINGFPTGTQPRPMSQFPPGFNLERHLETVERQTIETALIQTRWNKTAAARKLGLSFRSLRYRLKKLGLD